MADPEVTASQRELLRSLPARIPPERIDRLWLFTPHTARSVELGLVVVSVLSMRDEEPDRTLLTVRYQTEPLKGGVRRQETITEEGRAPPAHIERVIAGVLRRAGEEGGEPLAETIGGRADLWVALLERLGIEA